MDHFQLRQSISRKRQEIADEKARKDLLKSNLAAKQAQMAKLNQDIEYATIARELLTKATESAREDGKSILESAVTEIVQMVFDSNYEVEIVLTTKANNPVADVYVKKRIGHSHELINVQNEGGGLRDVISLAFFVAVSRLVGGDNGAFITFDEPTKAVSKGKAESVALAFERLTSYLKKQSIIITHEREYLPNLVQNVYLVEQGPDGISKAEEL